MIPRPPGDGGFLFQIPRGTPGRGILKLRIPRGPRGGGFFKATGDGISIKMGVKMLNFANYFVYILESFVEAKWQLTHYIK